MFGKEKWASLLIGSLCALLVGCAAPPIYSYLVYENPTTFVRLEFSPWSDEDKPNTLHAHPAQLSPRQMDEALRGLRVREYRWPLMQWILGKTESEPVFLEEEIQVLAPRLREGLELAVPQELVTFYISHPVNATKREVTSGGIYVTKGRLHIILSNHRTLYGIPPAGLIYDRRYPLFSLAPLNMEFLFADEETVLPRTETTYDVFLGDERSEEIVLDLSRLSMMKM